MSVALAFNYGFARVAVKEFTRDCGFARDAVKELTRDQAQEFQNLFPTASFQIPDGYFVRTSSRQSLFTRHCNIILDAFSSTHSPTAVHVLCTSKTCNSNFP